MGRGIRDTEESRHIRCRTAAWTWTAEDARTLWEPARHSLLLCMIHAVLLMRTISSFRVQSGSLCTVYDDFKDSAARVRRLSRTVTYMGSLKAKP